MKTRRYLFALPIAWIAAVSAAACSSSNNGSPENLLDGGGGGSGSECADLEICCTAMGSAAADYTECTGVVKLGSSSGCSSLLTSLTTANKCAPSASSGTTGSVGTSATLSSASSGTGTATVTSHTTGMNSTSATSGVSTSGVTGTTGNTGATTSSGNTTTVGSQTGSSSSVSTSSVSSNTGVSTSSGNTSTVTSTTSPSSASTSPTSASSSTSSSTVVQPTCANPPSAFTGFVPPTGVQAAGCTPAEVQQYASCAVAAYTTSDPYCIDPLTQGATVDGDYGPCGQCAFGTYITPDTNPPASWGMDIIVGIEPSLGDTADEWPLNVGPEVGVCIYQAGGAAAHQCGLDLMSADACAYAVCSGLCAIPNPGNGAINQTALTNFEGCVSIVEAAGGACGSYVTAAETDCAPFNTTGGVVPKCLSLVDQTYNEFMQNGEPDAGPATSTGVAQLLELACGGGDAGF